MVATDPSEFAASLNKIGVNYKIAYSVSIALRYIPDVQRDYKDISFAQQARGIDMSSKEKLSKRIKNSACNTYAANIFKFRKNRNNKLSNGT